MGPHPVAELRYGGNIGAYIIRRCIAVLVSASPPTLSLRANRSDICQTKG